MSSDLAGTLLLDPQVIDDPYPFYRELHRRAPVWLVPGSDVVAVSTFDMVAEAVSRIDDFSSNIRCLLYRGDDGLPCRLTFAPTGLDTLATADPPIHTVHRSAIFPELVSRRMAALEPEIAEVAARCISSALDQPEVDFMASVGNVVPITFISHLIGFHDSDLDRLLRAAFDSTLMLGSTLSLERLQELVGRSDDLGGWIADQIAITTTPGDTILGTVRRAVDAGIMGVQEGVITLHTLLSAGGESTVSLLGNAVRRLAEHSALQERLRSNLELVPAFVEEVLRLESPFRYLMRSVPETTTLGGVAIPGGATVLLLWGAANRDPAEFDGPDDIDIDRRAPRHHVAFGRGIHHCVGAPLARLEARVVITMLLERTSSITLDPDRAPHWVDSLLVRRHETLPVRLVARS